MPALGVGLKGVPQPSANLCHRAAGFIDQPEQKAMVHAVSVVLFYLIWLEGPRVCRLAAGRNRIRTIGPRGRRPPSSRCLLSSGPYFRWQEISQRGHEPVLKPLSCHAEPIVRI